MDGCDNTGTPSEFFSSDIECQQVNDATLNIATDTSTQQSTLNYDHGQINYLESHALFTQEEVLEKVTTLVEILGTLTEYHHGVGTKIQKMLISYYHHHPSHRQSIGDTLMESGYAENTMKMLKALSKLGMFKNDDIWFAMFHMYTAMWNMSDASPLLAKSLADNDAVRMLTLNLSWNEYLNNSLSQNFHTVLNASLSILYNIARNPENKHYFKEHRTTEALAPLLTSSNELLKVLAMLTTSYIIDEKDNETLIDDTDTIPCIVRWIAKALNNGNHRYDGFTSYELTEGLAKLAVPDSNKLKIVSAGALELFYQMLQSTSLRDKLSASAILWTLAFDSKVRDIISANSDLINVMEILRESDNTEITNNINGVFWLIREAEQCVQRGKESKSTNSHIFISYCWSDQDNVLLIKEFLQKHGYKVWIDVECMRGNMMISMAEGIENAALVLIAMSEKYKESPNCRAEAEYTFQLRKEYIPLKMQQKYRPDGWLGFMQGAKLYVDFTGRVAFDTAGQNLLKELNGRGQTGKKHLDEIDSTLRSTIAPFSTIHSHCDSTVNTQIYKEEIKQHPITTLTKDNINQWLTSNNLGHLSNAFSHLNGHMFMQFLKIRKEAPDYFYRTLENEFKMNVYDVLRLVDAMDTMNIS